MHDSTQKWEHNLIKEKEAFFKKLNKLAKEIEKLSKDLEISIKSQIENSQKHDLLPKNIENIRDLDKIIIKENSCKIQDLERKIVSLILDECEKKPKSNRPSTYLPKGKEGYSSKLKACEGIINQIQKRESKSLENVVNKLLPDIENKLAQESFLTKLRAR